MPTITADNFLIFYGSMLIIGLGVTVIGCLVLEAALQATVRLVRHCFKGFW